MNLGEHIKNVLCSAGLQEAAGVEVTFKDGAKLTIHSDDHPALAQPVSEAPAEQPAVRPVQSAKGGA